MKFELWPAVLQELANHLSEETIERWFRNVLEVEKRQSTLYLRVYSEEQAAWMETHYAQILQESVNKVADENLDIIYIADEPSPISRTRIPAATALTRAIRSRASWWAAATVLPTRRRWPWPTARPKIITRCSSTAARALVKRT